MLIALRNIYGCQGRPRHIALHIEPQRLEIIIAQETGDKDDGALDGACVHEDFAGLRLQAPLHFTSSIEELWKHRQWKDASVWCLKSVDAYSSPCLYNLLAETLPARKTFRDASGIFGLESFIAVFVPYAEADFSDMHYRVLLSDKGERLVANIPIVEKGRDFLDTCFEELLPTLSISGPDSLNPDAQGEYTLRAFLNGEVCEQPLDVELEHVNGYLPKTRVRVRDGEGAFRACALGLLPGDTLKIKAGFRYRASVAEKKIEVVNG